MVDELEMLGFLKTNGTQCRFVSLVIKTPVTSIRVGNPWGAGKSGKGLYKLSKKLGIINANYNAAVCRRIAEKLGVNVSQVEYENGKCWYSHLTTPDGKSLPVVQHNDEAKREGYYLQFFPHKSENKYVDEDGAEVDTALVETWLYSRGSFSEYKPAVIVVKLANIAKLSASGVVIEMPALEEVESIFS